MKVTNISATRLYLKDLKFVPEAQTEGRRGEDRYLAPGASVYLPETSEVLRSASHGDIYRFRLDGVITTNDTATLAANGDPGDSVVIEHNFNYAPTVVVYKDVAGDWVDATGTMNITHNAAFTEVTVENATAGILDVLIRVF